MVGICEGLTRNVGKKSLLMHRETGVFLWDEYAPKMAELIPIYSDKLLRSALEHLSMAPSFLMLMVHLLKLLNSLTLGGSFVFFSFSH